MSLVKGLGFLHAFYLAAAIAGAVLALFGHSPDLGIASSVVGQTFRKGISNTYLGRLALSKWCSGEQPYQAQIFSRDPLVIYIGSFLSEVEIAHLLRLRYEAHAKLSRIALATVS